jgi:hypothetical protein
MLALLIFPGGRRADAVVLSTNGSQLRLAIAGRADAVELMNVGGRWLTENGLPVEFGAVIALEGMGLGQVQPARALTATTALPC